MLNLKLNKIPLSRKTIGYAAYFVGITVFFLYYLFPSEAVKDYVAHRLDLASPDVDISIKDISPVIPPGIKLHDVGISRDNLALIDLESVKITPGLLSLFSDRKTARFSGRVHEGTVQGKVEIDNRNDQQIEKIEGTISGIQVQEIPALRYLTPHEISGNLGGDFSIARTGPGESMNSQLTLSECRIIFDQPVIGQSSLTFKTVAADLFMESDQLVIEKCSARGSDLDADITGTIAMDSSGRRNALNLNGAVTPHHAFLAKIENSIPAEFLRQIKAGGQAISFKIEGPMENPEFSLN